MFFLPQMEMMVKMDKIIQKYGLNAWIWYPMMFGDYSKAKTIKESLAENKKIFSRLPKIDAVFVPGGDPGGTPPKIMFHYLQKEASLLHHYHPKAQLWVSAQGFTGKEFKTFQQLLRKKPKWLDGIVFGPWTGMSFAEFRKKIPKRYPIRRYPDITHNLYSQYPVYHWDFAYAATENRESINPRPTQEAAIFRSVSRKNYYGFITYSEGVKDDVNKMIWSGLGWNPKTKVLSILRDYSRYFIGSKYTDDFAQGLLDLEKDWEGPLLGNTQVYNTLREFQSMNKQAALRQRLNWRFQEAMYRAYYDAYDRSRLIYETSLENRAMSVLRKAPRIGSLLAMKKARAILNRAVTDPVSQDWKRHIYALADALFQSIHMQLSVKKYYAKSVGRGATLDLINYPLNNRIWLEDQFDRIKELKKEKKRLVQIHKIVNWKNPGPGGFYDDLGDLGNQPHLVQGKGKKFGVLRSPHIGFETGGKARRWRVSWQRYEQTNYGVAPLKMHYSGLDTTAEYVVKVTYSGDKFKPKIRLMADNSILIHSYAKKPLPIKPVVYHIPKKATHSGDLTLEWNQKPGQGGDGRGCQIAEVWLMKKHFVESKKHRHK
jgi:hypothetical protein